MISMIVTYAQYYAARYIARRVVRRALRWLSGGAVVLLLVVLFALVVQSLVVFGVRLPWMNFPHFWPRHWVTHWRWS